MADYLIQSETLDDIADAINAKTGGSSAMTPAEMVTAIGNIPSGGGNDTLAMMLQGTETFDYVNNDLTKLIRNGLSWSKVRDVRIPNCTDCGPSAFFYSTIRSVFAPKAMMQSSAMSDCGSLVSAVFGTIYSGNDHCRRSPLLEIVDIVNDTSRWGLGTSMFQNDYKLGILILRSGTLQKVNATSAFTNTPFDSGGSGGTIYIPKVLYDHLGDGTSLDYKAATNWSTIDSYGTITWAQIEGSIYETQYADGTPIPSE